MYRPYPDPDPDVLTDLVFFPPRRAEVLSSYKM